MRAPLVLIAATVAAACGGSGVTKPTAIPSATANPSPNAFALSGTVHDTVARPIAQARVEVTDGAQRGLSVLTDDNGRYTFDPVFSGGIVLRASKAGYRDQSLSISHAQAARFFRLDSENGSISLEGMYELTFAADSSCTAIPGYARRRTYDATSSGSSAMYLIALSGGGYGSTPGGSYFSNVLYGSVFEDIAQVNLSDPPVWERFPQGTYLVISGQAEGEITELPATLPMWGSFTYCSQMMPGAEARCAVPEVTCNSSNHRLTIARS